MTDLYRRTLRIESKSSKFLENEPPSIEMLNIICMSCFRRECGQQHCVNLDFPDHEDEI